MFRTLSGGQQKASGALACSFEAAGHPPSPSSSCRRAPRREGGPPIGCRPRRPRGFDEELARLSRGCEDASGGCLPWLLRGGETVGWSVQRWVEEVGGSAGNTLDWLAHPSGGLVGVAWASPGPDCRAWGVLEHIASGASGEHLEVNTQNACSTLCYVHEKRFAIHLIVSWHVLVQTT